jgi:hypothetical protein
MRITPNCWIARPIEEGPTMSVYRNRSWRKNLATSPRPFRIEVFGIHHFNREHEHETLAEAQRDAESVARRMIGDLALWSQRQPDMEIQADPLASEENE